MHLLCLFIAAVWAQPASVTVSQVWKDGGGIAVSLDARGADGLPAKLKDATAVATLGDRTLQAPVEPFATSGEAIAYVVIADLSASRASRLPAMRQTIQQLAAHLRKADRMAILAAGDEVRLLRDFTSDRQSLEEAIATLAPAGKEADLSTAMARASEFTREQDQEDGLPRRRAVVAFTASSDPSYESIRQSLLEAPFVRFACRPCSGSGKPEPFPIRIQTGSGVLTAQAQLALPRPAAPPPAPEQSQWKLFPVGGGAIVALVLIARRRNRRRTGMPPPRPFHELPDPPPPPPVPNDPLPGLTIQLVTLRGIERGTTYPLRLSSQLTAGTAASCDLVLPKESGLAAKQFALSYVNQRILLRDLAGDASTTVNGVPVRADHPLSDGDVVGAGGSEFRLLLGKRE